MTKLALHQTAHPLVSPNIRAQTATAGDLGRRLQSSSSKRWDSHKATAFVSGAQKAGEALARLDLSGKFIGNKASFVIFNFRKYRGKYANPSQKVAPAGEIGPAACSTARSATTCVASRRVAAAYGVAHLALRTPFYVQNHDARSASTAVSRPWTRYARGNIGAQG